MSNDVKRCDLCKGRKVVCGLGMIEKECPDCFGVGWVSKDTIDVKKSEVGNNGLLIKKRGRKPKAVLNCANG